MTRPEARRPEFTYIPQEKLRFDPTNPRFGGVGQKMSQQEIQDILEREPHFALELVDSFLENGFVHYEPLVVRRHNKHFAVVEGNRRLAAVRHILANREKYKKRSTKINDLLKIPVLVFPPRESAEEKEEQQIYLGLRHLFGFRDWPAESKARFLDYQIHSKHDLERIPRQLNIRKAEVRRYLVPYRLRKAVKHLWQPYRNEDFWVLGEGLNRTGIREYLKLDVDRDSLEVRGFDKKRLKSLLEFVYGAPEDGQLVNKRIRETRDLSTLARVLESRRATAVLERGRSLDEAALFMESPEESFSRLRRLVNELKVLLKGVLVKRGSQRGVKALLNAFAAFERLVKKFIRDAQKSQV